MCRTVLQFHKFARFEPQGAPLDDKELAARVRAVTRKPPWHDALPPKERIVFPGYRDLASMSKAHGRILQTNIGLGWPTYFRLGNSRMFYLHNKSYQERTHLDLDAALAQGKLFVAYLSDFPSCILIIPCSFTGENQGVPRMERTAIFVYDPNHPDEPRELKWSPSKRAFDYEKDEEFVGGFTFASFRFTANPGNDLVKNVRRSIANPARTKPDTNAAAGAIAA